MALTNHDRVTKGLDLLRVGLAPFVSREVRSAIESRLLTVERVGSFLEDPILKDKKIEEYDVAALLKLMWETWNEVFRRTLGFAERSLVSEIRDWRNKWAHQQPLTSDDTYRVLDSINRLLTAVSAEEADEVEKAKMELLRARYDQQARSEKHKTASVAIESGVMSTLKPWREVITPHEDVASGRYQQAEFAADLWQVHLGEGSPEYLDPSEFFRRTYLTSSLKEMLIKAVQRLGTGKGDPVVQLQTNFGGGKTHSMLALYHLFSGAKPGDLLGVDELLASAAVEHLPKAKRVVLVGNKISPGNPSIKSDGTVVNTLWGELAWQLGGKEAFARIAKDDENATSPGDVLRELFNTYGPCLILIDEWVAYARQLHDQSDLPAGGFETQFSFAQVLTESAKLAKNCLLVVSLPASDTATTSPHAPVDDVEVGGTRGREALDRLRNVIGRIESSWRPASAEEGFEIVRRRLFQNIANTDLFKQRDVVVRAFTDFYRANQDDFPPESRESDYELRMKMAYPIHPEVFDRLYNDWSTLVKFQRTRGVLRLMSAVIHGLWEKGDRNPLILPANIAIDDPRIQAELTRYLSDNWVPVIEKDVDGSQSLPMKLDSELPSLGKFSACRRVARAIYLGSAPTAGAAHKGIEDRRIKLGSVMPGETPAVFSDALRRMSGSATYLYQDGSHYWYSTQATVTKLAEDRAALFARDLDKVNVEIAGRLAENLKERGDFARVHLMPESGVDVPDDLDARLVVLSPVLPYSREKNPAAEVAAKAILDRRGNVPRMYKNTLVFLAADKTRLQDLNDAVSKNLAWQSILKDEENLGLTTHQKRQVAQQIKATQDAIAARIPEIYQWLLVPAQKSPRDPIEWEVIRQSGNESLALRASKKLRTDEHLLTSFASSRVRMELDRVPLWRGDSVSVRQLVDDFAQYPYLPRLSEPSVLLKAISDGVSLMTWEQDSFAYADSFDESSSRYRGLRVASAAVITDSASSNLLVKPDVAAAQISRERIDQNEKAPDGAIAEPATIGSPDDPTLIPELSERKARRFQGAVRLDSDRVGRDAGRIAEEVIAHLSGLINANVTVSLEIAAEIPEGAPDHVVRAVTENIRVLRFEPGSGFEKE